MHVVILISISLIIHDAERHCMSLFTFVLFPLMKHHSHFLPIFKRAVS